MLNLHNPESKRILFLDKTSERTSSKNFYHTTCKEDIEKLEFENYFLISTI